MEAKELKEGEEIPGEPGRVRKGVRPYGGKRVRIVGRHTYPNGRTVIRVIAPTDARAGWMHTDIREYEEHQIITLEK